MIRVLFVVILFNAVGISFFVDLLDQSLKHSTRSAFDKFTDAVS